MTRRFVELDELLAVRSHLIKDIRSKLGGPIAEFLIGLQAGKPDFGILGFSAASELPAVRWKLLNLNRLIENDPEKHKQQTGQLEKLLH